MAAIKARWVQAPPSRYSGGMNQAQCGGNVGMGSIPVSPQGQILSPSTPPQRWYAVDEDDQLLASIYEDVDDGLWRAIVQDPRPVPSWGAQFLTLDGAKRGVQKQLGANYDFQVASTAWAVRSAP